MLQQLMTRRDSLASFATFAGGTLAIASLDVALASPVSAKAGTYELPKDPAHDLLRNAAWTVIGPKVLRKVYVIAAPWCPVCKALFQHIKRGQLPVQFRWISTSSIDQISAEQNAAIAHYRTVAVIDQIYRGLPYPKAPSTDTPWLSNWNDGINTVISSIWRDKAGYVMGVPQVWYQKADAGSFWIDAGFYSDPVGQRSFDERLSKAGIDSSDNASPSALAFDAANIRLKHVQPVNLFAIKTPISLHAVPDEQSPIIDDLKPRTGLPVTEVAAKPDGSQWAGLVVNSSRNLIGWALLKELFNGNGGKAFI